VVPLKATRASSGWARCEPAFSSLQMSSAWAGSFVPRAEKMGSARAR
jgi:hypothetical protein